MIKPKICVYAICKNELQFVDRFVESIGKDVPIYIGDTGSTDGTIEAFRKYPNVTVFEYVVNPWRFDHARQKCLDMIGPKYDLYFSLDLDEFIITPNWLKLVQDKWTPGYNQVLYTFEPYFDANGKPTSTFLNNRFHSFDFHWLYAIHEVITANTGTSMIQLRVPELVVHHLPDPHKTSTASYLPLLKMSYDEMPDDARLAHYLGREYFYANDLDKAIEILERHTTMATSWWTSERACSMRIIAECYNKKGDEEAAEFWFMKACIETPIERESYVELAKFYYARGRWKECLRAACAAYNIREKKYDHYSCNHYSWNGGPEDLIAIAWYNLGNFQEALKYAQLALDADPSIQRLKDNVAAIQNAIREYERVNSK